MTPESDIKVRQDAAVWREVDGETVLLDLSSASYLGINASGSTLWSAIVGGASRSRLVDLLVERFGLEPERATHDVEAFLTTCRARGLIE
jgi:hypothetical protein